jgi:hypothetical protein
MKPGTILPTQADNSLRFCGNMHVASRKQDATTDGFAISNDPD